MAGRTVDADTLDKLVVFLAKRDGTDKVLKVLRYTSKLVLVTAMAASKTGEQKALKRFEGSLATSRKAFRLGKWLANVNKLRRLPLDSQRNVVEAVALLGEGVYYFVEQFTWLVKAGALHQRHAQQLTQISAWAEFLGYVCSIAVKSLQVQDCRAAEQVLAQELAQHNGSEAVEKVPKELAAKLARLRLKRAMLMAAVVQDLADGLLALNDIADVRGPFSRPAVLCIAGLISAGVSIQKNWP